MIDALPLLLAPEGYQISRSVRLRSSASAYFNRSMSTASTTTWTLSFWFKTGLMVGGAGAGYGSVPSIFEYVETTGAGRQGGITSIDPGATNQLCFYKYAPTTYTMRKIPVMVLRDPSAWYHAVFVWNTTSSVAEDRAQIWINGARVTAWTVNTNPAQNEAWLWSIFTNNFIGAQNRNNGTVIYPWNGYMTEINFVDGQALGASAFGEFDAITGVWKPKKYAGTYGTNGFYLNFSDNSAATAAAIGKDYSGNGNNWTPNNISVTAGATYDSMLDVPTPWADGGNGRGNYATLNPLQKTTQSGTVSDGSLAYTANGANGNQANATMAMTTGKWYWEVTYTTQASGYPICGIQSGVGLTYSNGTVGFPGIDSNGWGIDPSGRLYTNNVLQTTYSTIAVSDIVMFAYDADTGKFWIGKNGSWFNSGAPASGTGQVATASFFANGAFPSAGCFGSSVSVFNFGQRPFAYTPPTGFKALNTQNLPDSLVKKGDTQFAVNTWTGNGTSQNIVNSGGMQPDLMWIKSRSVAGYYHVLIDSVRGITKALYSNATDAENTLSTRITAINSNGFTVGSSGDVNDNLQTFVGWQWKESAQAGFDIVTYTGTGVSGLTINHSLGVKPAMIIGKNRSGTAQNWQVWHQSMGDNVVQLNLTNAQVASTSNAVFLTANINSSSFQVGTNPSVNGSGTNHVAYLFAEVAGFSKFGSYTGNGSADGPFVFLGFRPRWLLVKGATEVNNWWLYDSARDTYNAVSNLLRPDLSNAEVTQGFPDFLSNGFKVRNTGQNTSGQTYIFAAFAENPFKYSLAR